MTFILPFKTDEEVETHIRKVFAEDLSLKTEPKFRYFDSTKEYYAYIPTIDNWPILPLKSDMPHRIKNDMDYYGNVDTPDILPYTVIPYAEEVFVIRPPVYVRRNEQGAIHCEDDFAIKYRNGDGVCAWRGTRVESYIIMEPEKITMEDIDKTRDNVEIRQLKIEKFGRGRWLTEQNATMVDVDTRGNITRMLLKAKDNTMWLTTSDGSTDRVWIISVGPNVKTCIEAGESLTNGLSEKDCILEA
jgi:uncharacterized protein DUF6745